jgi:hypothetical protein
MKATPGAKAACLLAVATLLWTWISFGRISWNRSLAFLVLCWAMILPYLCLPNHFFTYYALNWTVWEAGGGLLLLWKLWPDARGGVAIAILAAASLFVTQQLRASLGSWYSEKAAVNRNVLKLLSDNRARLDAYPAIAVEGAPLNGPWFGNSGEFMKDRLQLDHVWLVRVPKDSRYWRMSWELLGTDILGDIKTVAEESEPASPDMPLVKLSADGAGTIEYPAR